jgi:hypothetical protein
LQVLDRRIAEQIRESRASASHCVPGHRSRGRLRVRRRAGVPLRAGASVSVSRCRSSPRTSLQVLLRRAR